ncbi:MAG: phenylalanine--tRNA ligase subunit alpha [Patescibacteria group bacterium]
MAYSNARIGEVAEILKTRLKKLENKADILKATELKALYTGIPSLPASKRGAFGKELNNLKTELASMAESYQLSATSQKLSPIDVTAPFDINIPTDKRPRLLSAELGSQHPITAEIAILADIAQRMGMEVVESRQLDDDYHMFESLNFPEGHPARDDYDTFMTTDGFIAPAHTSTMQNRVIKARKKQLESGEPIAVLVPDRVFRNEDLDARHEHTFYQHEGVYVGQDIHVGHLLATLKTILQEYFGKELEIKTQPFYFPFTEPSFEFAVSCPFCDKAGCGICGEGWMELLGCGMIHPNVLKMAGVDPAKYTGFAWGGGIERLIMVKYNIEDVRHFESGKLDFLRQFS